MLSISAGPPGSQGAQGMNRAADEDVPTQPAMDSGPETKATRDAPRLQMSF